MLSEIAFFSIRISNTTAHSVVFDKQIEANSNSLGLHFVALTKSSHTSSQRTICDVCLCMLLRVSAVL